MSDAGNRLRVAVLGDSSATLYTQEDPREMVRTHGAKPWPELLERFAAPGRVQVTSLAGVGQQLADGLAGPYALLAHARPDVVVISHGGREGVVGLPRALGWLRCYAHEEAPYRGSHRLRQRIRRPIWAALVRLVDQHPRVAQRLLWPLHVRPVNPDVAGYRADLERTVNDLVAAGAHVVLLPSYIGHQSFWPVFRHIVEANDAFALKLAARSGSEVSTLTLRSRLACEDFAADGAHLNVAGHRRAAELVWSHLAQVAPSLLPALPSQAARRTAAVA
jgi:hypothetical protein